MRYRIEYLNGGQWTDTGDEYAVLTHALDAARLAKRLTGHKCRVFDTSDPLPWPLYWEVE